MPTTRPLIGCATYRKTLNRSRPAEDAEPDAAAPSEVYGLMPTYTRAVLDAGGLPVLIPLGLDAEHLHALLQRLDGVLLPGGGDVEPAQYGGDDQDPSLRDVDVARDRAEFTLIRRALEDDKPLLAICRGLQVVNVALGGTLWEDVHSRMPGAMRHDYNDVKGRDYLAHDVAIRPGSHLQEILGTSTIGVNSLHHQGIRTLAPSLQAVATAPDNLIEAVEASDRRFALAVQWHPETMLQAEPRMTLLFRRFVEAAANGAP